MTTTNPIPQTEQTGALVRALVQLTAEHIGRGPTKVRTTTGPDTICVVLFDTLTKSERTLIASGASELVADVRRTCFGVMRPALEEAARDIMGRDLLAVLGDHDPETDISSVSFIFAPEIRAYAATPSASAHAAPTVIGDDTELAVG